jgi:hypothetical protein
MFKHLNIFMEFIPGGVMMSDPVIINDEMVPDTQRIISSNFAV